MGRSFFSSLTSFVYLVVGVIVADNHKYFVHASNIKALVSAGLAIVLWPLLFVGVNLHIH